MRSFLVFKWAWALLVSTTCTPLMAEEQDNCIIKRGCNDVYTISWWSSPPYAFNNADGKLDGIIPQVLGDMLHQCCGICTSLRTSRTYGDLEEMLMYIHVDKSNFIFPVHTDMKKNTYLHRSFFRIVESPGIALYVLPPMTAQRALIKAVYASWPPLLAAILFSLISGVIFWIIETRCTNTGSLVRQSYIGMWDGFWWAFVSMVTIGYGDIYPKSNTGRVFSIICVLCGIVIMSLFTAAMTTVLISAVLTDEFNLGGSKVAVLASSAEYNVAVKKSAIPESVYKVESMAALLEDEKVIGFLLDSYKAGLYQNTFANLRLFDIIEDAFSYGIVGNITERTVTCMRSYLAERRDIIHENLARFLKPLKVNATESAAVAKSSGMFNMGSPFIKTSLVFLSGLLLLLVVLGLMVDLLYCRRPNRTASNKRKRNLLKDLEQMVSQEKIELEKIQQQLDQIDQLLTTRRR